MGRFKEFPEVIGNSRAFVGVEAVDGLWKNPFYRAGLEGLPQDLAALAQMVPKSREQGTKGPRERGSKGAREQGSEGTREQGSEGARERGNEGARERGNEGARERGSEGTRERGSEGTRERGSKGAREQGNEGARERGSGKGGPAGGGVRGGIRWGVGLEGGRSFAASLGADIRQRPGPEGPPPLRRFSMGQNPLLPPRTSICGFSARGVNLRSM